MKAMLARALALLFLFFCAPNAVWSENKCNVDCNKRCCRVVRVTPWDKNKICDLACKTSCESSKALCHGTGGATPTIVTPPIVEVLESNCAAPFNAIIKTIIWLNTSRFDSDRIANAKSMLVSAGLFSDQEFNGVSVKWCSLKSNTAGMVPDRGVI